MKTEKAKLIERIILVDTDYVDVVCHRFSDNFQKVLNRPIAPLDVAKWLVCCALDAGWRTKKEEGIQVVLIRNGKNPFPQVANYAELDGMAFQDDMLGEFILSVVNEEDAEGDPLFIQCVRAMEEEKTPHDVVLVPATPIYGEELKEELKRAKNCQFTLLSMEQQKGKGFKYVQLGFGLLKGLGISADEVSGGIRRK